MRAFAGLVAFVVAAVTAVAQAPQSNAAKALRETESNAAKALRETGSNAAKALQETESTPATRQGEVEKGRKLFVSYGCYQCHGYEAQGSTATGPRLGPKPLPLAAFSRYVRQPGGQMPPYTAKVLSDPELAALYAFVEARPAPKPVESIPLLK